MQTHLAQNLPELEGKLVKYFHALMKIVVLHNSNIQT